MSDIIEKLGIMPNYYAQFYAKRQESITRLVSIFYPQRQEVFDMAQDLQEQTYCIDWCIKQALSGTTWEELKELINEKN